MVEYAHEITFELDKGTEKRMIDKRIFFYNFSNQFRPIVKNNLSATYVDEVSKDRVC